MNIEGINFELANLRLPAVIIIGPPGAGKTVVGTELAKTLNWNFYDTDVLIEQATSMKVSEIFSKHTEGVFRQLEEALVKQMTDICQPTAGAGKSIGGTIISCGGGLPVPAKNFSSLAALGEIVCLQAPPDVLLERVRHLKHRPLLNSSSAETENAKTNDSQQLYRLEKLVAERKEAYGRAHFQVDTSHESIASIVTTIRTLLKL